MRILNFFVERREEEKPEKQKTGSVPRSNNKLVKDISEHINGTLLNWSSGGARIVWIQSWKVRNSYSILPLSNSWEEDRESEEGGEREKPEGY